MSLRSSLFAVSNSEQNYGKFFSYSLLLTTNKIHKEGFVFEINLKNTIDQEKPKLKALGKKVSYKLSRKLNPYPT